MAYFTNKIIWITGASSGIGEALAYELAQQQAILILSSRTESSLQKVQQKCLEWTKKVAIQILDLEQYHDLSIVVNKVIQQFGKIDVLVNNGGISQRSFALDTLIEVDERLMKINYLGTVALTKAVLPHMLAQGGGQIVSVTSLTGVFGTPYRSSYAASKHALHGFFDSLRAELSDQGITVTLIAPGFVKTNISYNALVGDGSPQNNMDSRQAAGMSSEVFAKKMATAIQKKKKVAYIGKKEVIMVYIKRFTPWLYYRMIAKVNVK